MLSFIVPLIASQSNCTTATVSPYGLLAGYSPTTDISTMANIDLQVRAIDTALQAGNYSTATTAYTNGGNYSLQGFSTTAKTLMYDCTTCPLLHYLQFHTYFGDYDYADKWVSAALFGSSTGFTTGLGDASFGTYTGDPTRLQAAVKGSALLNTWMYAIGMFEEAVALCATNNAGAIHAWDKGVAYYTGSLEGENGNSRTGTYGELTYAYAERQCVNFKTCGPTGEHTTGGSQVNTRVLTLFRDGQRFLQANQCSPLRAITYNIVQQMTIPIVQGTLKVAHQLGTNADTSTERWSEGATYAAALLPMLHYCDGTSGRTSAQIVAGSLALGAGSANFVRVKNAIEQSYQCLGITCVEVGGVWSPAANDYFSAASPCTDSQTSQTYVEVYPPIAGYAPGSNVIEHNEVDLDQMEMENATDLATVRQWYTSGGNSQKSRGRIRTIRGFSTGAQSKMYGGCTTVSPTHAPLTNIEHNPDYIGVKCYKHYKMYYNYYGDFDYADMWVQAALDGTFTNFTGGLGNADFSNANVAARKAAAVTGSAFLATFMYTVREYEDGIDDCIRPDCDSVRGCNEFSAYAAVHAWDEGVAFQSGSLEGSEGNSKTGNYGVGLYALAERRCIDFKTCGLFGGGLTGGSKVNHDMLPIQSQGNMRLNRGECTVVRPIVDSMVQLMTVPLIQSALLYAYRLSEAENPSDRGYAAGFAAALLPMMHFCDQTSGGTTAATLYANLCLGAVSTNFVAVKDALEANYQCMTITCFAVGGLWDASAGTYKTGAHPCGGQPICQAGQTGSECQTCTSGKYYSEDTRLCTDCPYDTFKNETSAADRCAACPDFSDTRNKNGEASASACKCELGYVGSIEQGSDQCHRCQHSIFQQTQVENGTLRTLCPGGETVEVPEGWYKPANSIVPYQCTRIEAQCRTSTGVEYANASFCAHGSRGPLCGSCADTHIIDRRGKCDECDHHVLGISVVQIVLIVLVLSIAILFEAYSAFQVMGVRYTPKWRTEEVTPAKEPEKGSSTEKASRSISAGDARNMGLSKRESFGIELVQLVDKERNKLMSYDPIVSRSSIADGHWNLRVVWLEMRVQLKTEHFSPFLRIVLSYTQLQGLLRIIGEGALEQSKAGRVMRSMAFFRYISLDWFLDRFTMIDCSVSQTMTDKTVVVMMVPVILSTTVGLLTLIWKSCVPSVGIAEFVRGCSFGAIVLYSAVIQKLLSNLSSVNVEGVDYALHDTSVVVTSSSHSALMTVSVVYATFYGLVVPALLLWAFFQAKKAKKMVHSFVFLVKGYKQDYAWWEYTVLARRFACCLIVSVNPDDFLASSLISSIFLVSLVIHMLCVPYSTSFLNLIELVNLFCVLLSAIANMVAFGTPYESVIEYAASLYIVAQLFFTASIVTVLLVMLCASCDKKTLNSMAATSLPAAIAKASSSLAAA